MHDLVGAYERLNDVYRKYIESAFPLRYPNMAAERRALYSGSDTLSQPPLLEPTPVYPSSNLTLPEAASLLPREYHALPNIAQGLLGDPDIRLWKHQWESVRTVLEDKRDLVVTTGTGSGKTECFLLPVLAELARESAEWPGSADPPDGRKWWEAEASPWQSQWGHTTRNAEGLHAIRAMVLYPLNTLVEDQLRRLRQTLDSESVLQWMDSTRAGNRVTFGRYTGATPVSGFPGNDAAVRRLRERLRNISDESDSVRGDPDLPREARYYFPNIDGGEMWSRWDMQDTPPDILITNYHMLNIMLMRQVEAGMFDKTRAWLRSDPANRFFLIVDELHSYRGTPGTEVAYILRLLLDRLGLSTDSDQLALLATSASVDDTPKSRKFLREFFGRDNFRIVSEDQEQPEAGSHRSMSQYQPAFEAFALKVQPDVRNPMEPPDPDSDSNGQAMSELAQALGQASGEHTEPAHSLAVSLSEIKADHAIRDACIEASGKIRATKVPDLDCVLFGRQSDNDTASDAMRGLLLALGMSRQKANGMSPQPVRGHFFYHNVQNMWVCANPDCDEQEHRKVLSAYDGTAATVGPVGALHTQHRITCSCGGRVLDLLVCEVCGDILLGGYRGKADLDGQSVEILTADMPNLADMPSRVSPDRKYGQYAVFWPLAKDEMDSEPEDVEFSQNRIDRRWISAKLSVKSGRLTRTETVAGPDEIGGWIYEIGGSEAYNQHALPAKCPRCDADYRRRNLDTPLRLHRTGFQKACQVVAGALAREMPLERGDKPGRKLLIFTDSRQDAAKLASGMEQDHYRDMVRILLLKALDEYWGALEAALRVLSVAIPHTPDRISSLNPTLGQVISSTPGPNDQELALQFQSLPGGLYQELMSWLLNMASANPAALTTVQRMIEDFPSRVPLRAIRDKLKLEFLKLGLNPGGNGHSRNSYSIQIGNETESHSWIDCYDWSQPTPQRKPGLPQEAEHLDARINSALMSELMFTLFQHSVRTIESLGVGWVTYVPYDDPTEDVIGATETIIRLLGIRWRHNYAERFQRGSNTRFPQYVERYLRDAETQVDLVKAQFTGAGIEAGGDNYLGLNPDNLYVVKEPMASQKSLGWLCPKCNAFFLHPTGLVSVCPNCKDTRLSQSENQKDFDYYVYLAEQSGPAFRLHCEELTGQTDDGDRPRRQRWFQEVFIGDEKDLCRVEGVDLLSVTTTMESGVDIGALEAVVMANMPPRRFNYQQRVGRAGRRGAGVSLAVTFCRGRSHDDYYYQRPEQITGEPPPPPYVDVSSGTIFKRVFAKELLRLAFIQLGTGGDDKFHDSVHGEFGPATEWVGRTGAVREWLNSPSNEASILGMLDALRVGTMWAGADGDSFCGSIMAHARGTLVDEISAIVNDPNYRQEALSERLAHAGLLPMFGFPTDARLLFTRGRYSPNPWPPQSGTIDRGLDIAISQFAPGSQIVKDKAVHTASGVANLFPYGNSVRLGNGFSPPLPDANPRPLALCDHCKSVQYRNDMADVRPCEVCGADGGTPIDAREPMGFFTDFQPEDYTGVFEWTPRSTLPTLAWGVNDGIETSVGNCDVVSFSDDILSVNDNDGAGGFSFQPASIPGHPRSAGAYAIHPGQGSPISVSGAAHQISLLSRRRTDVLLAGLQIWPPGVFADPKTSVGRAAWYSFAFFLRSSAAGLMDVDTQEFNAGFRPTRQPDESVVGQAFLSDTLQNGAGYCWWLGQPDNFEAVLLQGDIRMKDSNGERWALGLHGAECDTSCNRCLRDFYNLSYHGLLDWRLAIDVARLALDPDAILDLTTPWGTHVNPWQLLCSGINAPVPLILKNLGYEDAVELNGLLAHNHKILNRVSIVRHPLWTDDHPVYSAAKLQAEEMFKGCAIEAMNPFEVIRHPAGVLSSGK